MPTRNVNLTDELERFVLAKVASGHYENASEVIRAAINEGDSSGIAAGDVFRRVRKKLNLSAKRR